MPCTGIKPSFLACSYGHVYKLAQSELKGVNSVEGVEGILYQVSLVTAATYIVCCTDSLNASHDRAF